MSFTIRFDLTFSWDRHSLVPLRIKSSLKTTRPDAKKKKVTGGLTASKQFWTVILLGASVAISQVVTAWHQSQAVYIDPFLLLALMTTGLLNERVRKLTLAVAIIPLVNLASLVITGIHGFNQFVVFYECILVSSIIVWTRFVSDEAKIMGLRIKIDWNRLALLGAVVIVVGEALSYLGYLMLPHTSPLLSMPFVKALAEVLLVAVAEVSLVQGLIQNQAKRVMSPFAAIILATTAYACLYIGTHAGLGSLTFAAVTGAVLSLSYFLRKNLAMTAALNVVVKCVYLGLLATFVVH